MTDREVLIIGPEGWRRGGQSWQPAVPWVGTLGTAPADRRAALLTVAARARELPLTVVEVDAPGSDPESTLALLAAASPERRPRGLLLGEAWQEAAAARCQTLTGAAADLGLVDAVRTDDPERWQGHHLVAGAAEAFLAQSWPETAAPPPRAVILGDGATATAAALVCARRGAGTVAIIVADPRRREELAARLTATVNWPPGITWQVSEGRDPEAVAEGLWVRATARSHPADLWLPDAAGDGPCVLVDLVGATETAPLGFAHPDAGGVQVMAAGLAAAWYLGPPIPWDALGAASSP